MLAILNVLIGSSLLLFGRKLFWLLVGAIGFLVGLEVATRITFPSDLMLILATLGLGVIFALMAVFLESVAIGMAGFLGGGFAVMRIAVLLGLDSGLSRTLAFIVGAIIGVILVVWLFNWSLITISSLAGASMVVNGLFLRPAERVLLFVALAVLGIIIQGLTLYREGRAAQSRSVPKTK